MPIELLSPAGSLRHMQYAFAYGADAVYAGQPRYSLRVRNNSFDAKTLATGIEQAHAAGKRFFVASNIIAHNSKVATYIKDIAPVIAMQPDAFIMADPGLIAMVKERWPEQTVHLSVQANAVNWRTVRFWGECGVARVILSRELSLDEIAEIRDRCPDVEIEVFVHGALCIAYSGRCLLSGYFNHRDPNQGSCTNACRWGYHVHATTETPEGDLLPAYLLEETSRPGELMPTFEDEFGTYIMNSRDLRAVEHVHRLTAIGVDSLKIEGRTKSVYYVARTAQVYRRTIDDALAGKPFDANALLELENLASRGYTSGFYDRHDAHTLQNYLEGASRSRRQQLVGEIIAQRDDRVLIDVKNRFAAGDAIQWVTPVGNHDAVIEVMWNKDNTSIPVAPGSGHQVWLSIPANIPADALRYGFIGRYLDEDVVVKQPADIQRKHKIALPDDMTSGH